MVLLFEKAFFLDIYQYFVCVHSSFFPIGKFCFLNSPLAKVSLVVQLFRIQEVKEDIASLLEVKANTLKAACATKQMSFIFYLLLTPSIYGASGAKVEKDNILQRKSLESQNVGQT
jgi:hypothetical protein